MRFKTTMLLSLSIMLLAAASFAQLGDSVYTELKTYKTGGSRKTTAAVEAYLRKQPTAAQLAEVRKNLAALLTDSTASTDCKIFVCRKLSAIGTGNEVSVIAPLLKNEKTFEAAGLALELITDESAANALRSELKNSTGQRAARLINALGQRRDVQSVDAIAKYLKDDSTAQAAAVALGHIGSSKAFNLLMRALKPEKSPLQNRILEAIIICSGPDDLTTIKSLSGIPHKLSIRIAAFNRLAELQKAKNANGDLIAWGLYDREPAIQSAAIKLARQYQSPAITRILISKLKQANATQKTQLIDALGSRKEASAREALEKLAASGENNIQIAALRALANCGTAASVKTLAAACAGDKNTRSAAIETLQKLGGEKINSAVAAEFKSQSSPAIQIAMIEVLTQHKAVDQTQAIYSATQDKDAKVRQAAYKSLGEMSGEKMFAQIVGLLGKQTSSSDIRYAEKMVTAAIKRHSNQKQAAMVIAKMLPTAATADTKAALLKTLGSMQNQSSYAALAKYTRSKETTERKAATRALAQWQDNSPLKDLLNVANGESDKATRVLALQGVMTMISRADNLSSNEENALLAQALAAAEKSGDDDEIQLVKNYDGHVKVTGLKVKSKHNYKIMPNGFKVGALWATDRTYKITQIPAALQNATYIMTAMEDKGKTGDDFLSFTINRPALIIVGHDNRCTKLPGWLQSWQKTGEVIRTTDPKSHLKVYQKQFNAGKVTIGGNMAPGIQATYLIVIVSANGEFKQAAKLAQNAKEEQDGLLIPKDEYDKIFAAAPAKTAVAPKQKRKVLVFSGGWGFMHTSIPYGKVALEIFSKKTKAYDVVVSDDLGNFEKDKLKQFDTIVFNNCNNELFTPQNLDKLPADQKAKHIELDTRLKQNFVEYLKNGGGLVLIHAGIASFRKWPEFENITGTRFVSHPWGSGSNVVLKNDEPKHPVNACFCEEANIDMQDEIYQFKGTDLRKKFRVLFSVDLGKSTVPAGVKKRFRRPDNDFPLSWVRNYGKGRIYYCALGHQHNIFWNPVVLQHYLAGIQFALGDLEADATPVPR